MTAAEVPELEVLLFAAVREAAGTRRLTLEARGTVGQALDELARRFGPTFAAIADRCTIVVDGERVTRETDLGGARELAILPPVAGGR